MKVISMNFQLSGLFSDCKMGWGVEQSKLLSFTVNQQCKLFHSLPLDLPPVSSVAR